MPCFASSLFAISTTFKNTDSKKGEVGRGGGGEMRVKIPRDRLTMCRWIKKKLLLYFDLNKRLPFHSSLAQNRTKMGSITGHIIG